MVMASRRALFMVIMLCCGVCCLSEIRGMNHNRRLPIRRGGFSSLFFYARNLGYGVRLSGLRAYVDTRCKFQFAMVFSSVVRTLT